MEAKKQFKAQIVANSREASVRYKVAIDEALKEKISELENNNPLKVDIDTLRNLKTAVVISGSHNDKPHLKAFSNSQYHKKSIKSFKLPFGKSDEEDSTAIGNVGIIIVNNMLLTGFDAPIEQVLYLDRVIIAHNLLQAIARVNRPYEDKEGRKKPSGFVPLHAGCAPGGFLLLYRKHRARDSLGSA